ncbi:hypothetical protein M2161_001489 [Streptomyces sp. SAI-133]|uniref:hypothetical protein n=1 Tax=unclassified Streptomyces TaxID=2593676 RepID=UPI0024759DA0|nr:MULTISPECIES: hypothetical protein [unclassified Streptomyces]MDH6553575.1 hypothetical protein [Streptomyces sp. SAI-041]MDH6582383.1 hypothetical protein [Streptomyces sp. SAI-133]
MPFSAGRLRVQRATTASARAEFLAGQVSDSAVSSRNATSRHPVRPVAATRSSRPQAMIAPADASLMSYACCGARWSHTGTWSGPSARAGCSAG